MEPQNNQLSPEENPVPKGMSPLSNLLKNKKVLLFIVAGVLVVFLGGFLAAKSLVDKREISSNSDKPLTTQSIKNEDKPQKFAAISTKDYGQVCKGGVATNATMYKDGPTPHPIVLFTRGKDNPDSVDELNISFKNSKWLSTYDKVETTQLVGCFQRKSEGASKKCEFSSITLDYYAAIYELTVREAKTGKVVGAKEVNAPNLTCPSYTSYDLKDPKIYAKPDAGLAEEAVKEFVLR